MLIMFTASTLVMIMNALFMFTIVLSKKTKMSREKNSPFECGFSPFSSSRKPFSTHFFLIATLFLIFDIEISIILPMTTTKMTNMQEWMFTSTTTMMILMLGLIHEWKNGMLEWSK
uniref:NADH dehydrogenase subunit 3 n=1 Tax=Klapperibrachys cremeri TaxID=3081117 RepID=UPI002A8235B5|nr:NADH dehydrogenase subunit 3 [Klapperibrachys cremeri]WOW99080.1 NADH dehydrogenase subunit 3 [Klapperibrachys cremeri]